MTTTVGVCGFPRSGSSMLMRMLHVGGIRPVFGSASRSYELPGLDGFDSMPPPMLADRSVKLLDYGQWYGGPLPEAEWRFIWSDRDPEQQARSNVKFLRALGTLDVHTYQWRQLADSYRRDRAELLDWYRTRGPVLVTSFEALLADPSGEAERIAEFLPGMDAGRACYVPRQRSSDCAPDIAFERGFYEPDTENEATPAPGVAVTELEGGQR